MQTNWEPRRVDMLDAAINLDNIRIKRENPKENVEIDLESIYFLETCIQEHLELISKVASGNEDAFYNPYDNPLIDAILGFYGISFKDYENSSNRTISNFMKDIKTGLEMIAKSFDTLDSHPTEYPVKEIEALRDFCTELGRQELRIRDSRQPYRLVPQPKTI